jgi:hypothetical protein
MVLCSQAWTLLIGGKQLEFDDYVQTSAKDSDKGEKFLAEMEAVLPWQAQEIGIQLGTK